MGELIDVVKRGKRSTEPFTRDKLHASIVASCRSVSSPEALAHHAADHVCDVIMLWASDKPEITSDDIRRQAGATLVTLHPEAAYVYQHYHIIM